MSEILKLTPVDFPRAVNGSKRSPSGQEFPTFGSQAEAEAYSDRTGDAYFEICYHLEGNLNLCMAEMRAIYAAGSSTKRPRMQTGLAREIICPEGWPKNPKTLVYTLIACARFRHETTCHAQTIREAMAALVAEKEDEGTLHNSGFNARTFEPWTSADAASSKQDLLRLCDWIESLLHFLTHNAWYRAPDCFSDNPERVHLANIGITQRNLGDFSERDRQRWEGIHARAAAKHQGDLKMWGMVGKVQHDPEPRTWTHPDIDARIIGFWPLVLRYNWTYTDLLRVLDGLLPPPARADERAYPLDSPESLKVHCRSICGLTKSSKGKTSKGRPEGWQIAKRLFCRPESGTSGNTFP